MSLRPLIFSEASSESNEEAWLSIGDLMSVLFLIFVLLFVNMAMQAGETSVVVGELLREMKANDIEVNVDPQTGAVSFREDILFDEGRANLKLSGQRFLDEFLPVYSRVLFSRDDFKQEITYVVVEGHASSAGSYGFNMNLSTQRAMSVAEYIFSDVDRQLPNSDALKSRLLVAGRGETEARQDIDEAADRRVILRLNFRGDDLRAFFRDLIG